MKLRFEKSKQIPSMRISYKEELEEIPRLDEVVVEHSVLVLLHGVKVIQFFCTPEYLEELVIGHFYSEGYLSSLEDLAALRICEQGLRVEVVLKSLLKEGGLLPKNQAEPEQINTACGGAQQLSGRIPKPFAELKKVKRLTYKVQDVIQTAKLFMQQPGLFEHTGGVHRCALGSGGKLLYLCEDIGRHNAMDKVIGLALKDSVDLSKTILYTSGRVPSDMVRKLVRCKIPVVASHSAVTDSAVALAKEYDLTLLGFVRGNRCNQYAP